jgi:hypothetical protein
VTGHPLAWVAATAIGLVAAIGAALATRVQLLPDVIDVSIILTGSGLGSLVGAFYGAVRRYEADRLAQVSLGGSLLCGSLTAVCIVVIVLVS